MLRLLGPPEKGGEGTIEFGSEGRPSAREAANGGSQLRVVAELFAGGLVSG